MDKNAYILILSNKKKKKKKLNQRETYDSRRIDKIVFLILLDRLYYIIYALLFTILYIHRSTDVVV